MVALDVARGGTFINKVCSSFQVEAYAMYEAMYYFLKCFNIQSNINGCVSVCVCAFVYGSLGPPFSPLLLLPERGPENCQIVMPKPGSCNVTMKHLTS